MNIMLLLCLLKNIIYNINLGNLISMNMVRATIISADFIVQTN